MTQQLPTEAEDFRVPPPEVLYVDALGYVWQPGHETGFISMARTTARNLPSPDLLTYVPLSVEDRTLIRGLAAIAEVYRSPWAAEHAAAIDALAARIAPDQNEDQA